MDNDKYIIFRPLDSSPFYVKAVSIQDDNNRTITYTPLLKHAKRYYTREAAETTARLARGAAEVLTLAEAAEREAKQ